MKKILSLNYALIGKEILHHPSTIFTNDDIQVDTFDTEEALNYKIAQKDVSSFPAIPNVGEPCEADKIYAYGEKMVKCIQSHTRMAFTPEETPALWLIIEHVTAGYPEWVQPTGAHDAYKIGDRVTYKGSNWENKINANVWPPDGDIPYNRYWKPL